MNKKLEFLIWLYEQELEYGYAGHTHEASMISLIRQSYMNCFDIKKVDPKGYQDE